MGPDEMEIAFWGEMRPRIPVGPPEFVLPRRPDGYPAGGAAILRLAYTTPAPARSKPRNQTVHQPISATDTGETRVWSATPPASGSTSGRVHIMRFSYAAPTRRRTSTLERSAPAQNKLLLTSCSRAIQRTGQSRRTLLRHAPIREPCGAPGCRPISSEMVGSPPARERPSG